MKDEGASGYDGLWMNEEDQSASRPLTYSNCFHVDVQECNHHEMNEVCKKMNI